MADKGSPALKKALAIKRTRKSRPVRVVLELATDSALPSWRMIRGLALFFGVDGPGAVMPRLGRVLSVEARSQGDDLARARREGRAG